MKHQLLVGLTGGIGSGKSYVAQTLVECGLPVYDCDSNAKRLMIEDEGLKKDIISAFGPESYIDGELNKPYLAHHIFNDGQKLELMNSMVHPKVLSDFLLWADRSGKPIVCCESAILFESGLNEIVDSIVLVNAPLDIRCERVQQRDALSREQIELRIKAQMNFMEHEECLMHIIENDGVQPLLPQIWKLIAELKKEMI